MKLPIEIHDWLLIDAGDARVAAGERGGHISGIEFAHSAHSL